METIRLNNMQFHSHIGVLPEERVVGQDIQIDVEMKTNFKQLVTSDDVKDTLNYGLVFDEVAEVVANSRDELIETLGAKIIATIKRHHGEQLDRLIVRIRKLGLPIDGILANVEIELEG
ncbi:dihydroneopterin aldolase [Lactobacillus sp. Sy-1]|uniref:dihydroneopterin aldolase n=1 Tax=Lactobacillus sp. Sy-1 TaxID=2109645 RepID=UPI001C575C3F|nr:dihydroneopterin aldolase [Lactobacillus sp. Sy-1]MBW1605729.1 dihydroneopterin aldolase [Lactobacillus sp. Sy-1]